MGRGRIAELLLQCIQSCVGHRLRVEEVDGGERELLAWPALAHRIANIDRPFAAHKKNERAREARACRAIEAGLGFAPEQVNSIDRDEPGFALAC